MMRSVYKEKVRDIQEVTYMKCEKCGSENVIEGKLSTGTAVLYLISAWKTRRLSLTLSDPASMLC